MTPHRLRSDPVAVFLAVPLARMADIPLLPSVALAGLFTGVAQRMADDPFTVLLPLVVAATACDWLYGRRAARLQGAFRHELAQIGLHSKIGAIGIVCLIRLLEWWAADVIFETNGLAAVVLGIGLILEDITSIEAHRIALGARPIFMLSRVIAAFRRGMERVFPDPQERP